MQYHISSLIIKWFSESNKTTAQI